MTGKDHSLDLRRALVTRLKADALIASQVGARVYGPDSPATPDWPFVRVGSIISGPYEASCLGGMDATFAVNGFAITEQSTLVLNEFIRSALDAQAFDVGDSAHIVSLDWTDSQIVRDTAEADKWHGIVQFQTVTSENY